MTGPSSSPRGERAGTPGARWETELRSTGERFVPDGEPEPRPNRAARRAARRARKAADGRETQLPPPIRTQEAREGPWMPVSGPNSPQRTAARWEAQRGAQALDPAPPTRTETP